MKKEIGIQSEIDAWQEALRNASEVELDSVPNGWYTASELAREAFRGITESHFRAKIRTQIGKTVERRKFRIVHNGAIRLMYHYKLNGKS